MRSAIALKAAALSEEPRAFCSRSRTTSDFDILRARDSATISSTSGSGRRTVSDFTGPVYYTDVIRARRLGGDDHERGGKRSGRSRLEGYRSDTWKRAEVTRPWVTGHRLPVSQLATRGILVDGTTEGGKQHLLLQIFSQTLFGPGVLRVHAEEGRRGLWRRQLQGTVRIDGTRSDPSSRSANHGISAQ